MFWVVQGKTATPPGSILIRFVIRGYRFAQPPANSLNPFGVLLLPQRLAYNDERSSVGMQLEPLLRYADAERPGWVTTPERGNQPKRL